MNHNDGWFGVEIRHLAALCAVARERSFRGAADRLGYVQSSVSQQIAGLERLVGVRLIDRRRGSKEIGVTPLGERLVEHAEEILGRMRTAQADLAAGSEARANRSLCVGLGPGLLTGLLPGLLRELGASAPWLRVEFREAACDEAVLELVERREVDAAFTDLPLARGAFESRSITRDPCSLLVRAGSALEDQVRPPTLGRLAGAPLAVLEGARSTVALETWFTAHGVAPNVMLRASGEATLRAFVAAGRAAAILPRTAVEPWDERTAAIDLHGVVPDREVAVYWRAGGDQGESLDAFCEAATKVAARGRPARRPVELAAA